jgi:hypothetical protein
MVNDRLGADFVGPWKRAHIRSLDQLCRDAINLGEPVPGGLMGASHRPNPYGAIAHAKQALHKHPIHRWLQRRDPPVLREVPRNDPLAEFRLVHILLHCMTIAFAESNQTSVSKKRTDKLRMTARGVFHRAERYLLDGVVFLPNAARHNLLIELLAEAKSESRGPRPKAARQGEETYPALEALAQALYKELELSDVPLIVAVAEAVGPGCSEKTATRYVQRAKRS